MKVKRKDSWILRQRKVMVCSAEPKEVTIARVKSTFEQNSRSKRSPVLDSSVIGRVWPGAISKTLSSLTATPTTTPSTLGLKSSTVTFLILSHFLASRLAIGREKYLEKKRPSKISGRNDGFR